MSMTPKVGSRRVVRTRRRWGGQRVVTALVGVVAVLSGAVFPAGPAMAAGTVITPDLPSVIPGPPQVLDTGQTWSYPTIHVVVSALLQPVPPKDEVVLHVTGPVFGDFDSHTNPLGRDTFRFNLQCAGAGSGEIVAHWQTPGFFNEADSAPAAYTCPPAFRLIAGEPIKDWANGWASKVAVIGGVISLGAACLATVVCAASVGLGAGSAAVAGIAWATGITATASGIFWWVNHDPPDLDYRTVYVPVPVSVPAIAPGPGLSVGAASALENYAQAAGEFTKWGRGFYISINRAQGAQDAADTAAFDLQVAAARGYAAHAATALRAWSVLETGLRAALAANGLANEPVPASDVATGQDLVLTSGLPAELVSRLDAAGATAEEKQTVAALAVYDEPAATDLYGLVDPIPETPTIFANLAAAFDAFATSSPPPTVTALDVASGPAAGGTRVTLTGTHLAGALNVQFGNTDATAVVCTDTDCTVTSPPGGGVVDVTVTTPAGTSQAGAADQFTYVDAPANVLGVAPAAGPSAGGNQVIVTGDDVGTVSEVDFGTRPATRISCAGASCTATAPPGVGTVDVRVKNPAGMSAVVPADQYRYLAVPTGPDLIGAGDFEAGAGVPDESSNGFEEFDFGKTIGPWHVAGAPGVTAPGGVEVVYTDLGQPFTGSQFLAFGEVSKAENSGPAQVTQTVATTPGRRYTLRFALAGKPFGGAVIKRLQATLGTTAETFSFDATNSTAANKGWVQEALTAPVCSSSVPVTLRQLDPGTNGPEVDHVTLTDAGPATCRAAAPTVTRIAPGSGPASGATRVALTGTGLAHATAAHFGTSPGTGLVCRSDTLCRVNSPAGSGTVRVTVTSAAGTSAAGATDRFTYLPIPPAGKFQAVSLSWVSPTHGFALGTTACGRARCSTLLRTIDGGTHWKAIPAPHAPVNPTGTHGALDRIRFANDAVGYAFGSAVYSTHDGGRQWSRLNLGGKLGVRFTTPSLEVSRGRAYLWAQIGHAGQLYTSAVTVDRFVATRGVVTASGHGTVNAGGGAVAVAVNHGPARTLWTTRAPSTVFSPHASPCGTQLLAAVAVTAPGTLSVVCDSPKKAGGSIVTKRLLTSNNTGRSWHAILGVPQRLHTMGLAQPARCQYVVTASGAAGTQVQLTADAGRHWTVGLTLPTGSLAADFGFTTTLRGFLTATSPLGASRAWRTSDGGRHWALEPFHA
jgi:IPT/TIG domain